MRLHEINQNNRSVINVFHATNINNLDSIEKNGIKPISYWGIEKIANYYAETIEDNGDEAVIIALPLNSFNEQFIEPDFAGIEEPITTVLKKSENSIHNQWEKSKKRWNDSLRIIGSFKYRNTIYIKSENIKTTSPLYRLNSEEKLLWDRFVKYGIDLPYNLKWLEKYKN